MIILGSVLIGTGTNLVLFRTGVRDDPSIDVVATIIGCGDLGMCVASYERDGRTVQATYFLEGSEAPPDNSTVEAILYPGHEERLYASADVPVWVSVVLISVGLPLVAIFCVKLYKHWRGEFRVESERRGRGRSGRARPGTTEGKP